MEEVVQPGGAQGKGQHHPRHRHGGGLGTHRHQLIELAFEAGEKQQGKQADLGHGLQIREGFGVDLLHRLRGEIGQGTEQTQAPATDLSLGFRRHDQVQAGHADQHASHQLPEDGGQLDPDHQLGQQPGGHKDHQEFPHRDEGFGDLHLMAADFKQKRWQDHGGRGRSRAVGG